MEKITEINFETLINSARKKIYEANRQDLEDLREKLEALYVIDVNELGMDSQRAVVECCLETYEHCAEMTCDTLYRFLIELVPWLEQHTDIQVQSLINKP
ncbi:MAG: hypothetical protein NC543_12085 [bacterium]|nr:hypothetical protein [bacterium]MCM1376101.1 hypothetical protein [Muribaculum sp.]